MKYFCLFIFTLIIAAGCKKDGDGACTTCATNTGKVRFVPKGDYYYKVKLGTEFYQGGIYIRRHAPFVFPSNCTESCLDCGDWWPDYGSYDYKIYRDGASGSDSLVQSGSVTVSEGSCAVINCTE